MQHAERAALERERSTLAKIIQWHRWDSEKVALLFKSLHWHKKAISRDESQPKVLLQMLK